MRRSLHAWVRLGAVVITLLRDGRVPAEGKTYPSFAAYLADHLPKHRPAP